MTDWTSITQILMAEPTFRDVPRSDLARFLSHVEEIELNDGEVLLKQDADANHSYLIVSGQFTVAGSGNNQAQKATGFLGEETVLGLKTYLATATAIGETQLLKFPKEALLELAKHGPIKEQLVDSYGNRFRDPATDNQNTSKRFVARVPEPYPLRITIGWALAVLVPAGLLWWLGTNEILPNQHAMHLTVVISIAVIMWVFRLMPDFIPALFTLFCIIVLGIAPPSVALGGFASNAFCMALSIFGLSIVISVSGLSYRLLLWLLRVGPPGKVWYNFCLFITGLALTPVVPTTNGRVAILAPFTNDMLEAMGRTAAAKEGPRLTASVMGGASLLSAIFLSSKSINFLVFGLLPVQEQARYHWLHWLHAAVLCGLVLLSLYLLATWLLFRNDSKPAISKAIVTNQSKLLGPMRPAEWAAVFGLVILLMSFFTAEIHHIDIPWVALAILFAMLMFQFLSAKDFQSRIDWAFLIYLACLIGLGTAMTYTGLNAWLAQNLSWLQLLMRDDFPQFVAMLAAAIFAVRLALPINATVVIFATLLIPTAVVSGANPWLVGFIILLLSESFIWPYQASYYAQFRSMALPEAGVDDPKLVILHFLEFPMKLIAIYASFPYWHSLGII